MTFSKEQLQHIIESADEVITALAGTNDDIHPENSTKMCAAWDDLNDRNAPPSVVKKLAELALAGMKAQPVINRQSICNKVHDKCSRLPGATFYNAAEFAIDEVEACRAAMLQAGNSQAVTDGWVACSERMPEQGEYVSAISRHGECVSGQVIDDWLELHDGTSFSVEELYLWMPLPALPAAPQHEVKNG